MGTLMTPFITFVALPSLEVSIKNTKQNLTLTN